MGWVFKRSENAADEYEQQKGNAQCQQGVPDIFPSQFFIAEKKRKGHKNQPKVSHRLSEQHSEPTNEHSGHTDRVYTLGEIVSSDSV
jgi:hypothetical protein